MIKEKKYLKSKQIVQEYEKQLNISNIIQHSILEKFGKFIDDIRKKIKYINIQFSEEPFGESMTITIPPSTKSYIIDTTKIGKIEYDSPMYMELLEMTIEQLKMFNKNVV